MDFLGLKDTLEGLAWASGVRRFGRVLRRNNGDDSKWREEEGVGDRK